MLHTEVLVGLQNWSREETDQLFDMCERFDMRFIIIADRFSPPRTVEELKQRYYSGEAVRLMSSLLCTGLVRSE